MAGTMTLKGTAQEEPNSLVLQLCPHRPQRVWSAWLKLMPSSIFNPILNWICFRGWKILIKFSPSSCCILFMKRPLLFLFLEITRPRSEEILFLPLSISLFFGPNPKKAAAAASCSCRTPTPFTRSSGSDEMLDKQRHSVSLTDYSKWAQGAYPYTFSKAIVLSQAAYGEDNAIDQE